MARPRRIHRTLALRVSEPRTDQLLDESSPGQRFARGWARFATHRTFSELGGIQAACDSDAVMVAGYLAAKAAWDAHHYATNWI